MSLDQLVRKYQKRPVAEYDNNVLEAVPDPLVTVRVSTYNHFNYIAECLEGILMQKTSFPFEICIGEDDSSDGTRDLCVEYAQKHPQRIRLFLHSRENNIQIDGRPTARFQSRYTAYMGRGKYEAVCEGDDYWTDPLKLQKQVDFLDSHPECSLCFHKAEVWSEACDRSLGTLPLSRCRRNSTLEDLLDHCFILTCTVMFRRGLFGDLPDWYYEVPVGDWPLYILNAQHGDIGYIDEVMAVYRQHSQGVWSGLDDMAKINAAIRTYEALSDHLGGRHRRIAQSMLAIQHYHLAAELYRAGDPKAARRNLEHVLEQFPAVAELWQEHVLGLALKIEDTDGYDAAVQLVNWTCDGAETRPETTRWTRGLRGEWYLVHTFKASQEGDRATSRRMAWRAVRYDWRVLGNRGFRSVSLAACLGPRAWKLLKQFSRRFSHLDNGGLIGQESENQGTVST